MVRSLNVSLVNVPKKEGYEVREKGGVSALSISGKDNGGRWDKGQRINNDQHLKVETTAKVIELISQFEYLEHIK